MKNRFKVLVAALVAVSAIIVTAPVTYAARCVCESGSHAGETVSFDSGSTCATACGVTSSSDLMGTVNTIISVILGVVGFVAVVMIIIGGISYTTSAGDASKVKKAKDTILYGVVGLVIALLAFAIVNFVLTSVF